MAEAIRAECRQIPALRWEYGLFLPKGTLNVEELSQVIEIAGEPETNAWRLIRVAWCKERMLDDEGRVRLLQALMHRADGPVLIIEALNILRHVEEGARDVWPEALRAVGLAAVIAVIDGCELNDNLDDSVARTLSYCLRGDNGADANRVMDAVLARASHRYGSTYDLRKTLSALARQSPGIFLRAPRRISLTGPVG